VRKKDIQRIQGEAKDMVIAFTQGRITMEQYRGLKAEIVNLVLTEVQRERDKLLGDEKDAS
jgi:hypothetical protein